MGERHMGEKGAANPVAHHLRDAIDRVREDVAKIEFWADAMASFSQPVPDYEAKDVNVWTPSEQAKRISPNGQDNFQNQDNFQKKRTADSKRK